MSSGPGRLIEAVTPMDQDLCLFEATVFIHSRDPATQHPATCQPGHERAQDCVVHIFKYSNCTLEIRRNRRMLTCKIFLFLWKNRFCALTPQILMQRHIRFGAETSRDSGPTNRANHLPKTGAGASRDSVAGVCKATSNTLLTSALALGRPYPVLIRDDSNSNADYNGHTAYAVRFFSSPWNEWAS